MKQKQTWRGRRAWLVVLLPVLVLMAGAPAWAQRTVGDLRGTVTDSSGAVVPGATVLITNVNKGYTRELVSDTKGDFAAPVLDPGQYRVEVTAGSFKKSSQVVTIAALATTNVAVKLELGGLSETVEITAPPEGVNVSNGGVAQHLNKEVLEMPNLNHYGFSNATLMPAINQSEERRETINASVAGNDSNRNAFYIDGAEATDPWRGWSPRQPVADAFEEIVVNTAGATVDVGSNFGGTYNAVFKSGTNQFHGSAWYYFRDKGLNANSWVNNRVGLDKPDDPLKYWGGQIGGPVIKDKLFFYFTANRETDQQPYSDTGLFAPTPAMVNGDFSAVPFTINDPKTGRPFPGNVIPSSRIDPTAKAFWDKYGYSIGELRAELQLRVRERAQGLELQRPRRLQHQPAAPPDVERLLLREQDDLTGRPRPEHLGLVDRRHGRQHVRQGRQRAVRLPADRAEREVDLDARSPTSSSRRTPPTRRCRRRSRSPRTRSARRCRPSARTIRCRGRTLPRSLPTMVIGNWWGDPETSVLFNGWTTDFTVKNITAGSSATWIKSLAQRQGRRRVPERQLQHDQARGRHRQHDVRSTATSPRSATRAAPKGSKYAHSFADFLLGHFDSYNQGDGYDQTLKSWNLRPVRHGHLARHPAPDHHARPASRDQQRDQRGAEPADGLPARVCSPPSTRASRKVSCVAGDAGLPNTLGAARRRSSRRASTSPTT